MTNGRIDSLKIDSLRIVLRVEHLEIFNEKIRNDSILPFVINLFVIHTMYDLG